VDGGDIALDLSDNFDSFLNTTEDNGGSPTFGQNLQVTEEHEVEASSAAAAQPIETTTTTPTVKGGGAKVESDDREEKIMRLMEFGFDRQESVKALEENGWNFNQVSCPSSWSLFISCSMRTLFLTTLIWPRLFVCL